MTDTNLAKLAFKFKLEPNGEQRRFFSRTAGCTRFVYNHLLFKCREDFREYLEEIDSRQSNGEALNRDEAKKLSFRPLCYKCITGLNYLLPDLRKEYPFLQECPAQALQQKAQDLMRAYHRFFYGKGGLPRFKKKALHNSFRFPQGFELDEDRKKIWLPKIGWVKYRKSRNIFGKPKNVTVSLNHGDWYISVQTEFELKPLIQEINLNTAVGIDMGVIRFATLSDENYIPSLKDRLNPVYEKIEKLQRRLSRKKKDSKRYIKLRIKLSKLHKKLTDVRYDYLQKESTRLVKNHDIICVEDLKVKNMTKSAKGTIEEPGRNVKQKSGLNREILKESWSMFFKQLEYKLKLKGGIFVQIPAKNTSRACHVCGYVDKENRKTQAEFKCIHCGHTENADVNAAKNIKRAGLAQIARQVNCNSSQQREAIEA